MFFLYHHHDLDRLGTLLAALRERRERTHPLEPDTVVVPNQGVGRWLEMRLAESEGVAANLEMPLPARFIWDLIPHCLPEAPDTSDFGRARMTWHVYAVLPEVARHDAAVAAYLAGEPHELHRLQLAERLADVFDQYLIYRPSLLDDWQAERGRDADPDRWQATVWRALIGRLGGAHRARLLQRFVDEIVDPGKIPDDRLPDVVYCFGLDQLPPEYVKFLYALGQRVDVHFLLPNPCDGYWGDIEARKISLAAPVPDEAGSDEPAIEAGHPLLASLGRSTRDFLRVLYSEELSAIQEPELGEALAYEPPAADTLLARVQADIVRMHAPPDNAGIGDDDVSIQVHACHGPLREVQVLHDQLLDLLERGDAASPRDIVVMMPDVAAYAPAIHSVFGSAAGDRYLPYSISDAPRSASHPVVQTVQRLLDLPLTRWPASEILELAAVPAIMRRFDLDEAALNTLREWTQSAGVRWGFDAGTRAAFGAGAFEANTWRFGLDRLLLGVTHSDDDTLIDGVAPWTDLEGGATAALGQFWHLLDRLRTWQQTLTEPAGAAEWQNRLNAMVDDLLAPDSADHAEQAALDEVRAAIDSLDAATLCLDGEQLGWEAAREIVSGALGRPGERQPFLSGGVTFCSLMPLRAVPFSVVCVLGMDDGAFPRTEASRAFNILRARPRPGDASVRDDDRLLFLQALTAARSVFYISYTGQDVASGEALPPSPVVGEWLAFLHRHYFADTEQAGFDKRVLTRQPMHPFSEHYFRQVPDHPRLFTYAREWQPASRAGHRAREPAPAFDDGARAAPPEETTVELPDLRRFFDNPAQYFLRERLAVALDAADDDIEDTEPQQLDGLSGYQVRADLLARARRDDLGEVTTAPDAHWRARGLLPPPPLDAGPFGEQAGQVNALLPVWRRWAESGGQPAWRDIDLHAADQRLRGRIGDVWPDGPRRLHPARLRMKHMLRAWIDYLAWRAAGGDGELRLAGLDKQGAALAYRARIDASQAGEHLAGLLRLFREGQQTPLLFLPSLAETYLDQLWAKDKHAAQALAKTNERITDDRHGDYEAADPYFRMILAGDPPLGAEPGDTGFCELAETICGPLFEALEPMDEDAS